MGVRNDKVDGATDQQKENEMHNTWEDHFEKTVERKLENLRLDLQYGTVVCLKKLIMISICVN